MNDISSKLVILSGELLKLNRARNKAGDSKFNGQLISLALVFRDISLLPSYGSQGTFDPATAMEELNDVEESLAAEIPDVTDILVQAYEVLAVFRPPLVEHQTALELKPAAHFVPPMHGWPPINPWPPNWPPVPYPPRQPPWVWPHGPIAPDPRPPVDWMERGFVRGWHW